jgi:hypothetical protein
VDAAVEHEHALQTLDVNSKQIMTSHDSLTIQDFMEVAQEDE